MFMQENVSIYYELYTCSVSCTKSSEEQPASHPELLLRLGPQSPAPRSSVVGGAPSHQVMVIHDLDDLGYAYCRKPPFKHVHISCIYILIYLYVYILICLYVYMFIYLYAYTFICVYMFIYSYVLDIIYIYICVCVRVYTLIFFRYLEFLYIYMFIYLYSYMFVYIYIYVCVCMYADLFVYLFIYLYVYVYLCNIFIITDPTGSLLCLVFWSLSENQRIRKAQHPSTKQNLGLDHKPTPLGVKFVEV